MNQCPTQSVPTLASAYNAPEQEHELKGVVPFFKSFLKETTDTHTHTQGEHENYKQQDWTHTHTHTLFHINKLSHYT